MGINYTINRYWKDWAGLVYLFICLVDFFLAPFFIGGLPRLLPYVPFPIGIIYPFVNCYIFLLSALKSAPVILSFGAAALAIFFCFAVSFLLGFIF